MKKFLLVFILFLLSFNVYSQVIHLYDTIINMQYYKSYYSRSIKGPSYIIYKLYKGGGDVNRASYSFKGYRDLPYFNYYKSGYDKGHLVPAEDLANTNLRLKSTFYYINCIPQHPSLNRGVWKKYENTVRKCSQADSLLIVCGGCDYSRNSCIPKYCFKVVYNIRTKQLLYALYFRNDNSKYVEIDNEKLKKRFTYKKIMNLYNKK